MIGFSCDPGMITVGYEVTRLVSESEGLGAHVGFIVLVALLALH